MINYLDKKLLNVNKKNCDEKLTSLETRFLIQNTELLNFFSNISNRKLIIILFSKFIKFCISFSYKSNKFNNRKDYYLLIKKNLILIVTQFSKVLNNQYIL